MTTTTRVGRFQVPHYRKAPAGAAWLGNAAARFFAALQRTDAPSGAGATAAQRGLDSTQNSKETTMNAQIIHPPFGREFLAAATNLLHSLNNALVLTAAETPAQTSRRLRALANDYAATQPSYADDLYAAADAHTAQRG